MRLSAQVLLLLPLCLTSADALAWGLYTHVYFAQLALWAVPLADPRLRRAARRLPRLVLAGACLPDLSLASRYLGAAGFDATHGWGTVTRLLRVADDDDARALALGYASHLFTDTLAHNHFVPVHETLWPCVPHATHAICEWALDHELAPQLFVRPAELLEAEAPALAPLLAAAFDCRTDQAELALSRLAVAERTLRASRLPAAACAAAYALDRRSRRRFRHFVTVTARALADLERLLEGDTPGLDPEVCPRLARQRVLHLPAARRRGRLPLPSRLFDLDPQTATTG